MTTLAPWEVEPRAPRGGLPPHDDAAEEAVLAALLLDTEAIHKAIGVVDPADFFRPQNAAIFEACIRLAERGEELTPTTVAHYLDEEGAHAEGALTYLVDLLGKYWTGVGVEAHARLVARDAQYRRLIDAAGQIAVIGYKGGPEPAEVQGRAEAVLSAVATSSKTVRFATAADIVARLNSPDHVARRLIATGLRPLDKVTGGFGLGDLVAIGAHTSHGKTAFAAQVALNMAMAGTPVGYLPIEGSDEKILERITAMLAGGVLPRGPVSARVLDSYMATRDLVAMLPLYSVERQHTPRSVSAVCAWITSLARGEGVKVFFLDHIDDMDVERTPGDSLATSYHLALRRLQNTAARENVSIVFLSQVNRGADDTMPSMRALRESGAKEELSQLVVMLWLDYRPESIAAAASHATGGRGRFLWARVEKNTEGEIGDIRGPASQPGEAPLAPFVLNLDSMTVEEVSPNGRAVRAIQPALTLPPQPEEVPPWPED